MREFFLKLLLCTYTVVLIVILSNSISFGQDVKTPFAATPSPLANRYAYSNNGLWIDSAVKLVYYRQTSDSTLLGVDINGKLYKMTKAMIGHWVSGSGGSGSVTSVGLAMPSAFSVTGSPVTGAGTLTVTGNGTSGQYITGTGALATFPTLHNGTVTAFSAGGLSPLFTTSVSNATTTPTLSFAPANAPTASVFGNFLGGAAAPDFYSISDLGPLLPQLNQNTTGSAGSVAAGNITGTTLAGGVTTSSLTSFGSSPTLTTPRINVGSDATGDLYYRSSGSTLQRVGIGSNGQVLTVTSGLPAWATGAATGVTSVSGTTPINVANGTTTPSVSIDNAAADGSTKGAASFAASDFNSSSGNISIDYTNGQAASASQKGFLTSSDWNTFNGKQGAITLTTTGTSGAATLVGSTLNIPQYSGGGVSGVGTFNTSSTANGLDISGNSIALHAADGTNPGALTAGTQTIAGVKTFTNNSVFQPTVTTGTGASAGVQIIANSLTSGNGLEVSSSSLTSGNLVKMIGNNTASVLTLVPDGSFPNALVAFLRNQYNAGVTMNTVNSTTGKTGSISQVYSLELGSNNSGMQGILLGKWAVGLPSGSASTANSLDVTGTITASYSIGVNTTSPNSAIQTTSFAIGYIAKSANYTLGASDYIVNCTSNSFTITLPTAAGITGREYIIKNSGSGTTITVATTSSQTIDGTSPGTVTTLTPLRVVSDGTNWITW